MVLNYGPVHCLFACKARGLAPRVLAERKSVACVVLYLWFLNF